MSYPGPERPGVWLIDDTEPMLCPLTGFPHRLFWMRSAWWCHDCKQKIESCCEGGGCLSVADVLPTSE